MMYADQQGGELSAWGMQLENTQTREKNFLRRNIYFILSDNILGEHLN